MNHYLFCFFLGLLDFVHRAFSTHLDQIDFGLRDGNLSSREELKNMDQDDREGTG